MGMDKPKLGMLLALAVIVLLGGLVSSPVMAQEPQPTPSDDEVNAIAKRMYCPVCENIPLDVCATTACEQWREMIREKLMEGWTEEEIFDYFVTLYGDRVLSEPPRTGLNWLIYVLPPIFLLIGVYVIVRGFRTWKKPVESLAADAPDTDQDAYISRLEEELEKRK
jgi:cytochrome c-type biogenesis protein CcmH